MLPDRFSAFIRWWVNTSSRSSAYSSKDMSEASIGAGFAAAGSSYKTSKIICVPHVTSVNSRRCSTLQFWSRGPATQQQHESTATKIQPYDSEVVALPRKNNTKVTKYCTCQENPTLRFWSRGPAMRKQPESHKVLHLPQKSNLTVTLAEKTRKNANHKVGNALKK